VLWLKTNWDEESGKVAIPLNGRRPFAQLQYCSPDYVLANPPFNVDDVSLSSVEKHLDIQFPPSVQNDKLLNDHAAR
jgi:hypothetical protein